MLPFDEKLEALLRDVPDVEGARLFIERLSAENARATRLLLAGDAGLLSDALALAAWSPLLATTLAQHPDYLTWLARERTQPRVKTTEELGEALARFAATHSQLDPQLLLARFRRRELLRIYLRDIRHISTLVETTEELSNLADAVLHYAFDLAQQELDNLYGPPQRTDERGRYARADFCIVALGKLGSHELNYASDIDLLFLYSDDGLTAETGTRGAISNREYFGKLAERIARLVGHPSAEGAAYRVDLRLRPHGRDGALSCSLMEAARYYRETAQNWELQALIRARAAGGSARVYARFAEEVRARVYRPDETVAQALAYVRLAKQKIDRHHGRRAGGFNVKLGRGGIREIEFIAQALQLAYGGHDAWLHAPHTLISLGRLADRGLITERERSELSEAYDFLRTLEHRLQMEQGLQTHSVPEDPARRALVARRMDFTEPAALESFNSALEEHTTNVRAAYERVFSAGGEEMTADAPRRSAGKAEERSAPSGQRPRAVAEPVPDDPEGQAIMAAASLLAAHLAGFARGREASTIEDTARHLRDLITHSALNPRRAMLGLTRIAASFDKSSATVELSEAHLASLIRLCGASEYFGEMIAGNPSLIAALPASGSQTFTAQNDYAALLRAAVESEGSFGGELAALRRAWARLLVEIGARDVAGEITLRESNQRQTALAIASLDAGQLIARRELERRYGGLSAEPRLSVLGLGRLGGGGLDYGSDLDVVLIFDDGAPSPIASLTPDEAYARFAEILITALSSMTRGGYLYRLDLRLRPDGVNGAVVNSSRAFIDYLKDRAAVWEWLAYVKLRGVAGDRDAARRIEDEARRTIHEAARRVQRSWTPRSPPTTPAATAGPPQADTPFAELCAISARAVRTPSRCGRQGESRRCRPAAAADRLPRRRAGRHPAPCDNPPHGQGRKKVSARA